MQPFVNILGKAALHGHKRVFVQFLQRIQLNRVEASLNIRWYVNTYNTQLKYELIDALTLMELNLI